MRSTAATLVHRPYHYEKRLAYTTLNVADVPAAHTVIPRCVDRLVDDHVGLGRNPSILHKKGRLPRIRAGLRAHVGQERLDRPLPRLARSPAAQADHAQGPWGGPTYSYQ